MLSHSSKPQYQIQKTKKGFTIVNVHIDNYPIATSSLWVNAGSSKDPIEKQGLAHFFEHLFLTRTKKYPNRQKRLEEIEKNGFLFNAFTSLQYQHYFYIHSTEKSNIALELLIDGLTSSILDSEDIEREKKTILSEEQENYNDPASSIWRLANVGIWGKQGLGKDFYGSKETISSIDRSDMLKFYEQYFLPKNILFLFINSSLPVNEQEKVIDQIVINDTSKSLNEAISTGASEVKLAQIFQSHDMSTVQLALTFLTTSVKNVPENTVQDFITHYLAGGWTSRLIQRLRLEENITYWVYPECNNYENTGYLRFNLSVIPENVEKVLAIFQEEILKLKKGDIALESFKSSKNMFISNIRRSSIDYSWLMQWYGYRSLLGGSQVSVEDYCQSIEDITINTIQDFATKYFVNTRFSVSFIASNKVDFSFPTFQ